jgi:SAM-dependent methyltransferase
VSYEQIRELYSLPAPAPATTSPDGLGAEFEEVEEEFGRFLDESLSPRGPESLYELAAAAGPPSGGLAVDVGCGRGCDTIKLAERFGLHVHGVDPVPVNIETAKSRARATAFEGAVEFSLGRAEALPLAPETVDVLWCKEVITFTDLDRAMCEFGRVLRPTGFGVVYQVITGPAMSEEEAQWFAAQEMGFGPARSLRPSDVEQAIGAAGLVVRQRVDYASEWGEAGQENDGAGGRRLVHAARLLRDPQRYIMRFGEGSYRIMLADCLWHVYRMIGKLYGVAFVIERAR